MVAAFCDSGAVYKCHDLLTYLLNILSCISHFILFILKAYAAITDHHLLLEVTQLFPRFKNVSLKCSRD